MVSKKVVGSLPGLVRLCVEFASSSSGVSQNHASDVNWYFELSVDVCESERLCVSAANDESGLILMSAEMVSSRAQDPERRRKLV